MRRTMRHTINRGPKSHYLHKAPLPKQKATKACIHREVLPTPMPHLLRDEDVFKRRSSYEGSQALRLFLGLSVLTFH